MRTSRAPPQAWANPAASLAWDCRETVEHIADDLFAYATESAIHVDRDQGAAQALAEAGPWAALLWATGRADRPGHPRLAE